MYKLAIVNIGKGFMDFREKQLNRNMVRTDEELWDAVVNDNASAFATLFERYWSTIYKTAFSYSKNNEQSEEITHDIFLNLWRSRHVLTIQSFSAYLRAAARYHVFKCLKAEKASMLRYVADWDLITPPLVANDGDERIRLAELEQDVDDFLVDLPTRCKEIFFLSRKERLSNDEIAGRLGISKRSVENQITRALKHLRVQLKATIISIVLAISLLVSVV